MKDELETPREALDRNLQRIKTEGLDAATDAAVALLRDGKAPAQAKSALVNAMFRAAGLFTRIEDDDDVPIEEMTPAQVSRALRDLEGLRADIERAESSGDDDIFG